MEVLEVGNAQMTCRHINLGISKLLEGFGGPMAYCHGGLVKLTMVYLWKISIDIHQLFLSKFLSSSYREVGIDSQTSLESLNVKICFINERMRCLISWNIDVCVNFKWWLERMCERVFRTWTWELILVFWHHDKLTQSHMR